MHPQPHIPITSNPCADLGWYQTLCKGFDHLGLDGVAICEEAGIHAAVAKKLSVPALSDALSHAFEIAQKKTDDPRMGLRMARHPLGSLGPLSHMLLAANNTHDVLEFVSRYLPLFWPMATMDIQSLPDRSLIVMNVVQGRRSIPTALYDFFVCMVLSGYRIITGKRSKVLRLHHPGPMPEDPRGWLETFGVVEFGASRCAMELATESMHVRVPTANPAILELSERIVVQMQRRTVGVISDRIRKELVKSLQKGEVHRKDMAAQLGMSERSLCRRLAEEGTTFLHLLDSVRREMAETYIQQGSFNPTEITFALGFSDPSNFYRACKRWFGQMPVVRR
jgi:AraC-like DNA-binding protein